MRRTARCMRTMTRAMQDLVIKDLQPRHEAQWRVLWGQYAEFYKARISEAVTAQTWQSICEDREFVGLAATRSGALAGFAIAIVHKATWSIGGTVYLEDLFVAPSERGRGIGRALIDEVLKRARERGCASVYWHTQSENAAARRLYDSYCQADNFVRYRIPLET